VVQMDKRVVPLASNQLMDDKPPPQQPGLGRGWRKARTAIRIAQAVRPCVPSPAACPPSGDCRVSLPERRRVDGWGTQPCRERLRGIVAALKTTRRAEVCAPTLTTLLIIRSVA
jgi:hypothetical protein